MRGNCPPHPSIEIENSGPSPMSNLTHLRDDAEAIWRSGVAAVDPLRLLPATVVVDGDWLQLGELSFSLREVDRIVVVGGGKAGARMAVGLERALGDTILASKQVSGVLSVPADCLSSDDGAPATIELVAGRPAGVNEPRPEGAAAAARMLELVSQLGPRELCLGLISGGGSALLPVPIDGVSIEQKAAVTRLLSSAGATIDQLNAVRKRLSRIKGGGLARAARHGQLVSLIISDVLGDPLDVIASGPTVPNRQSLADAIRVFDELRIADHPAATAVLSALRSQTDSSVDEFDSQRIHHVVIANNAAAVDAAGIEAERRGYNHVMHCATQSEGPAEEVGQSLAELTLKMRDDPNPQGPNCLITGGEPTVKLVDSTIRGRGGRNQQLVLAAIGQLGNGDRCALLSGGTDGEDGPTNAAGAVVDAEVIRRAAERGLDATEHLQRNDAYPFFEQAGGLLVTGPTHTNVCDIRVAVVERNGT